MNQYSSPEELQAQGVQIIARPPAHFKPKHRRPVVEQLRQQQKKDGKTIETVSLLMSRLWSISPLLPADRSEMQIRARIRTFFQRFQ